MSENMTENIQEAARSDQKLSRRQRKKQEIAEGKRTAKVVPRVEKPGLISRASTFFQEAKAELLRVTWPTRTETVKSTGVLLVLVAIAAVYLGLVDTILNQLLKLVVALG